MMKRLACVFAGVVCCLLVAAALTRAVAEEPKPAAFTAKQVLDRMAKTYAQCKSYRDSGMVKTVFVLADGNRTMEKPFTTAFVRPDRFRFEYSEAQLSRKMRYIVWWNGREARSWWSVMPGVKKEESLGMALAAATGVSGSSAHTIPALLVSKEVGGRRLTDITDAKRIKDAQHGKVACFRIEGKFADSPMTLWIDQKHFLVRRIDLERTLKDFRTEETTTYEPVVDEKIADKLLKFDPPDEKSPQ
jgi:outer membrane lipoprotein-sorting protein